MQKKRTEFQCLLCKGKSKHYAKGYCINCYMTSYYSNSINKKKHNNTMSLYFKRIRKEVIGHYSKGIPKCKCCGETIIEFLSIDHKDGIKNNDAPRGGSVLALWLKRNNYPIGYQVLCYNCNLSLGFNGYCPHKKKGKL